MSASEEYEWVPDDSVSSALNPMGFLYKQMFRFALAVVVLIILIWLVSKIPVVGPPASSVIRWAMGAALLRVGLISCG
jgi:hypothetical protein